MIRMNRLYILVVIAVISLLVLGCAQPAPATPSPTPAPTANPATGFTPPKEDRSKWPKEVSILGCSAGSSAYVISAGWGELIKKYVGLTVTAEVGGCSGSNAKFLGTKEAELAHLGADALYMGYRGIDEFKGKAEPSLRVIGREYLNRYQVYTLKSSGIKELKDIKGRSFMWMQAGSTTNMAAGQAIMEYFGWDPNKDIKSLTSTGGAGASKAISDRSADVSQSWSYMASHIIELTTMHDVYFIPIPKEVVDLMIKKFPAFVPTVLEAGAYKGMTSDVPSVGVPAWYSTYADMPDDFVYAVTKALWDHLDEFKKFHPIAAEFSLKANVEGAPAPYHPGAIAYLKEKGLWDAKMDALQAKLLSEAGKK